MPDYPKKNECLYCPYFCEENIWHLSQHPKLRAHNRNVVFISNLSRQCFFHNQKAGENGYVIWDYHVVLLADHLIFDFDSLLRFPVPLQEYLNQSFGLEEESNYSPLFKLVEADAFVREFSSDRNHMLNSQGKYLQPPPVWEEICDKKVNNLDCFIDMQSREYGAKILSLNELYDEFR